MNDIIIFGLSRFAELVHYYLSSSGLFNVHAFSVDKAYMSSSTQCGLPVVPFEEATSLYPPDKFGMFIAVGYGKLNRVREAKYHEARRMGYSLASYVHSTTTRPDNVRIGDNVLILEQNVLQPFAQVGNDVIVWSNNLIAHDSYIGDHTFISSHALVGGETQVGERCFIGIGASIGPKLNVGNDCIIGAGCLLISDAAPEGVYGAVESERRKAISRRVPIR